MKCEYIHNKLSEYLEGLLDHENYAAVQSHISSCSHCQAEVQTLERGIRAVANLPAVEPPPGFSEKVMTRIREEAERPRLWQRLFLPMRVKIPIHAMALLLVAGLAVYLYQANRPTALMNRSFKTPAAPPTGFVEERQKETDKLSELKRDGPVSQEALAKRKMADVKSAKPASTMPAVESIQTARYELTFKPIEEAKTLPTKLEALVKQAGGEYIPPGQRTDGLKQNFRQEPQIVWLVIPQDRYDSFKTGLSALGKIESEIKAEGAPSEPLSSAKISSMFQIKLTIRSTEKP